MAQEEQVSPAMASKDTHTHTHGFEQYCDSNESTQWGDNTWRNAPLKSNNHHNNHLPLSLSVSILLKNPPLSACLHA